MSVLQLNNVSRFFGGIKAVSGVNMDIAPGEILGLIGPNGAGKTTLFNLLTGIYKPTEGDIIYNFQRAKSTKELKPYKIGNLGVARTFQNIRLFGNMTLTENVKAGYHNKIKYGLLASFFRTNRYYKGEEILEKKVLELLDIFNLLEKKDELAKNLPYGDQRRLEIARALASEPKILLLDEPAAGMNPKETNELMHLIKWIRDKFDITIILIEHDMSLVMSLCSKIFVLDYGEVIAEGTPEEIKKNPKVINAYLGGEGELC
ncbi:amino acid/amide ABC transporter ATP-binding protein 1, HAAT family [Clostridium amylolyticum]|uniref:Amino acid/amide ABC transporter ATP-binding protein 1, HAAT family n=1 Tax=Clostridium amylolyticum TaxID=1121298 RepID=A0A1M6I2G4_9CLOT|nr:ABC transporter ATP-binding protein [Clostridium amylolyticum]SHJ28669.1 amino acid/amide ABC transporter ATP-binding protein 1, HAAT family [Clostridium amylolyticum]